MNITIGTLLKNIRENVFNDSIRTFSEKINMHYTTYHNYEKNNLGKNPLKIIYELNDSLVEILEKNFIAKTKLKESISILFLQNTIGESQDCNYIINSDIDSTESLKEYIKYLLLLTFNIEIAEKKLIADDEFHGQRRYCINKVMNLYSFRQLLVFSHIEDYHILLQIAHNTPQTNFNCLFDEYSDSTENTIYKKCSDLNIKNFLMYKTKLSNYIKKNKTTKYIFVNYYLHHIQKDSEKIKFLKTLYDFLPKNGIVIVADPFFDKNDINYSVFKERWEIVKDETYSKKFWTTLNGLDKKSIAHSEDYATRAKNVENIVGNNYVNKIDEYPVSSDWIENIVKEIGFNIILNSRTNCYSDGILIISK